MYEPTPARSRSGKAVRMLPVVITTGGPLRHLSSSEGCEALKLFYSLTYFYTASHSPHSLTLTVTQPAKISISSKHAPVSPATWMRKDAMVTGEENAM